MLCVYFSNSTGELDSRPGLKKVNIMDEDRLRERLSHWWIKSHPGASNLSSSLWAPSGNDSVELLWVRIPGPKGGDSLFCIGTAPKAHSDSHSVTSKGTGGGLFLSWQPQPLGKRSSEIACEAPCFCRVTTDCRLLHQTAGQQELARLPWLREYQVV